jgi:hypothetical protein
MSAPVATPATAPAQQTPRVAIVCRDDAAGEAATSFIAQLGLEPILSQEPGGDSSLDGLEVLRQASFALVLQPERQLEIGFLLAALGRGRVCVLQSGAPVAGLGGLLRQDLDDGGLWRLLLAREMKQAGLEVDLNKAL